ncbi:LytR C-terminal domain-containing protein [Bifidobacterium sp.]|uniref:LytR C-terminal domain-containing protein n=1 Tax=Bifidobacterium sp. TaxID=41200 RepID=UPI003D7DBD5F
MAKQGKETYESYAKDMFDNPPAGPMGVHRGARSAASRAMPYVIVVVASLLAGLLFWGIYSGEAGSLKMPWAAKESSSTSSTSTGKKSESKSEAANKNTDKNKEQADDSSDGQSSDATDSDQNTEANQSVNLGTQIRVVNATNITGYAKSKADALTQAGYTSVTADNPTGNVPSQTVVWYQNEADKATAENVAQTLNIANVEQSSSLTTPIVVVLLN